MLQGWIDYHSLFRYSTPETRYKAYVHLRVGILFGIIFAFRHRSGYRIQWDLHVGERDEQLEDQLYFLAL